MGDLVNNDGEGVFIDDVIVDISCDFFDNFCVFNVDCVDSDFCMNSVCIGGVC